LQSLVGSSKENIVLVHPSKGISVTLDALGSFGTRIRANLPYLLYVLPWGNGWKMIMGNMNEKINLEPGRELRRKCVVKKFDWWTGRKWKFSFSNGCRTLSNRMVSDR